MPKQDHILKIKSVVRITALSPASINRAVQAGRFPAPLKLGKRGTGWLASDIEEWIESRRIASIEAPFNLEAQRNSSTFADPRTLFERPLWGRVDYSDVAQLAVAFQSCSLLAENYRQALVAHDKSIAQCGSRPEPMAHTSDRDKAHSAISAHASEAWSAYQPNQADSQKQWKDIWESVFVEVQAWVDTNNIVVLRVLLEHLLDIVSIAQFRMNMLSQSGQEDRQH